MAYDPTDKSVQGILDHLKTNDGDAPNQGKECVHWNNLTGVPANLLSVASGGGTVATAGTATTAGDADTLDGHHWSEIAGLIDSIAGSGGLYKFNGVIPLISGGFTSGYITLTFSRPTALILIGNETFGNAHPARIILGYSMFPSAGSYYPMSQWVVGTYTNSETGVTVPMTMLGSLPDYAGGAYGASRNWRHGLAFS